MPLRRSEFLLRSHGQDLAEHGRSVASCSASTCRAARYLLLEVDSNSVKKDKLDQVRDDVRRTLREARIGYTGLATRPDSVEVRVKDTDLQNALTKLRELSQPLGGLLGSSGQRSLEVSDAGGGLIRLTVPPAAINDRVRQSVDQSIQIVERRVNELGTVEPLIEREGADRILVQVPGLQDPTRLKELLGKTAKIDFRMVDTTVSPDQAVQGNVPADSEVLMSSTSPKIALCRQEAGAGLRRRSDRRAARLRPALGRTDRQLPLQYRGLAQIRPGDLGECRATLCDRARQ